MTAPTVAFLFRQRCMCGADDRQCHHCGHPFEVPHDHSAAADSAPLVHLCPRCGQPSTTADQITRSKAAALRVAVGLIP